ncbi:MAG: serine hydrolase [Bacteroidales bacterium]
MRILIISFLMSSMLILPLAIYSHKNPGVPASADGMPETRDFYIMMDKYLPGHWDGTGSPYAENIDPTFIENWVSWMMDEEMIPGLSLCFLKDGALRWETFLGYADLKNEVPVTDATIFLTASVSKTIVVTAAMQLYEQGLFDLDDDINDYLPFPVYNPEYPFNKISFRHLMTHLSSVNDDHAILESLLTYGSDSPIPLGYFLEEYMSEDGIYYSPQNYSTFPPEQEFNYTNVGAALLGFLVEKISGVDFESYCQDNVFMPLGMENVSFRLEKLDSSMIAVPYRPLGDTIISMPHVGFPFYPAGSLRSNAEGLSRVLSMYMNNGQFNQNTLLQESSVDTITTLQYPEILWEEPMGLMWFYKYGFFKHGGGLPGAQSEFAFSEDQKSAIVTLGNSNNADWTWFMEYVLINYADHYEPFSIESVDINDEDGDNLLEPGEQAELVFHIRNNSNTDETASDVGFSIFSSNQNITLVNDETTIGELQYLDTVSNTDDPFILDIGNNPSHYPIEFDVNYTWNNGEEYGGKLTLEAGPAEVLLVDDAITFGGMFLQSAAWYEQVLDSLGQEVYLYDMSLFGDPSAAFLANFPVVIWFTGMHYENTLNENNMYALSQYLDNGGNLFLTGQNISEDIRDSDFLSDYLHAEHILDTYHGKDTLLGVSGDPIGDGLLLTVNRSFDAIFQFSMSELLPVKGGTSSIDYFSGGNSAAIRFENAEYKTVFFGFGFEGINTFEDRLEVMRRILEFFDETVGDDDPGSIREPEIQIYPNPVHTNLNIHCSACTGKDVTLLIYDLQGRTVRAFHDASSQADHYHASIDVRSLPPGIYFYDLLPEGDRYSGKFIVTDER